MDDFIKIYDDTFSEEECEEIMFFIDKLDDCRQLGSSGVKKHLTDHKSFNASHNFHTTAGSWLGEKFLPKIAPCVNDYLKTYAGATHNFCSRFHSCVASISSGVETTIFGVLPRARSLARGYSGTHLLDRHMLETSTGTEKVTFTATERYRHRGALLSNLALG